MKTRLFIYLLTILSLSSPVAADQFLVTTTEGPGFSDPQEVAEVLEKGILPTFDKLMELETSKKIVAGGLAVGSRTFHLIIEADSHDEVDSLLRNIPGWGVFSWDVTPLQSVKGRAEMEKQVLKTLRPKN